MPPGNLIRTAIGPNPIVQCSDKGLPLRKSQRPGVDYFWDCFRNSVHACEGRAVLQQGIAVLSWSALGPFTTANFGSSFWRAFRRAIRHAARPPYDEVISDLPDRNFALLLTATQLVFFLDLQSTPWKPDPYRHVPSRTLCPTRHERFTGAVSSRLSNFD
ncbi:hypothetical protein MESS2_660007 [Mesorhizobium metallidurans STM 2683]|uniref:Uncharacterized protein n=1 Tax=Mesorhizobium metallidurans STM 2683 TaxID=1297569 RepID=M5EVK8_9HYPH|nr:hypothetical protein MESS2_660007 [Mesorhizobium metallidurans STM 2683]